MKYVVNGLLFVGLGITMSTAGLSVLHNWQAWAILVLASMISFAGAMK